MWGSIINPTNDIVRTGILNWPSQLCSFTGNGYTTAVGTWRKINPMLWKQIPSTDVRKGWWVDDSLKSPISDNIIIPYKGKDYPAYFYFGYEPYVNVKFGAYQDIPDNTTNASDWIMMRAEEMILIKAEGLAMSGDEAGAKTTLESFMQTYRDPSYTYTASNMRDEIWLQRRIELWGEGFAYFDVLRLKKGLERIDAEGNSAYHAAYKFNVPAEASYMIWPLPRKEVDSNEGISEEQNNQMGTLPKPE
jgi:hypothetical protein